MKLSSILNTLLLMALMLVNNGCSKSKFNSAENSDGKRVYGKAGCSCIPSYVNPHCEKCITSIFMGNLSQVKYEAYFTKCESGGDPQADICNVNIDKAYKVTFCYASPAPNDTNDCSLYMQIDDAPDCIKCITTFPYCVKLKATCSTTNNKDYVITLDDDDPNTLPVVEMQYTISQDPKFTICCKKQDPSYPNIFYTYCCSGDLIRTE